jgi:precorrin-2 dehydrogenase/sirohydrochlorin ferrochelatase
VESRRSSRCSRRSVADVPDYFPAFLDLRGRRCLVVGGGLIGERKTRDLLTCSANVVVVSPALSVGLTELVERGHVVHRARSFRGSDVRGCAVVVAATGVSAVDSAVAEAARRHRALVNVVDRPALCDFIVPSVLRRGELQIAVSTGGRSPALAREIRREIEGIFGSEYADLVDHVGAARSRARARVSTLRDRMAAGERVVALALSRLRRSAALSSIR